MDSVLVVEDVAALRDVLSAVLNDEVRVSINGIAGKVLEIKDKRPEASAILRERALAANERAKVMEQQAQEMASRSAAALTETAEVRKKIESAAYTSWVIMSVLALLAVFSFVVCVYVVV